jgi:hypothetical protein
MAGGVWLMHKQCVCMRTNTEFRLSDEVIRDYKALLGDQAPKLNLPGTAA